MKKDVAQRSNSLLGPIIDRLFALKLIAYLRDVCTSSALVATSCQKGQNKFSSVLFSLILTNMVTTGCSDCIKVTTIVAFTGTDNNSA